MDIAAVGVSFSGWTQEIGFVGDWSSDVCSAAVAELPTPVDLSIDFTSSLEFRLTGSFSGTGVYTYDPAFREELTDVDHDDRSEERRVGKEGRSRMSATQELGHVKRKGSRDEKGA